VDHWRAIGAAAASGGASRSLSEAWGSSANQGA